MRILFALLIVGVCQTSSASTDTSPFPFNREQLAGWWAESYNTDLACGPQNVRSTMEISPDGKRLDMRFDRLWKTAQGETDHISAAIVSSTSRSITIRYDRETRLKSNGQPQEWELTIVVPGVYRWRETDWKEGKVNVVVGIRCSSF
jgi:hypothetical protein